MGRRQCHIQMIVGLCVWFGAVFLSLLGCGMSLCVVVCVQFQCDPGCVLFLRHRVCRFVHVCSVLLFFLLLGLHMVWYSVEVVV